ncbi:MAG: hypothetical protein VX777_01860 [Chlamydiota bacterium]|nr:hypothetical protein [Chlamydiota bacterium]
MNYTYCSYSAELPDINRIYTLEFTTENSDEEKEIVKKSHFVAQELFSKLIHQLTDIQSQNELVVERKKMQIMQSGNISKRDYFHHINTLQTWEEKEKEKFKIFKIEEHQKFHSFVKEASFFSPNLHCSNESWIYCTHLGKLKNYNSIILVKYFDCKEQKCLLEYQVHKNNFSITYPLPVTN